MSPSNVSSTSSEMNFGATLGVPMPTPRTPTAPYFKGKHVSDFLDSLEQHADSARISHDQLPSYILRYCHTQVKSVIKGSTHLSANDWAAARNYLIDLYGSNDSVPKNSPDRLRQWCFKHGESKEISSRKDVDKYYREFTRLSSDLTPNKMLANDVNLCFYRGIPTTLRLRIKKRLPAENLKMSSAPAVETLLGLLRSEFDEDDLDAKTGSFDLDVEADIDSDSALSDSEDDDIDKITVVKKTKKPLKKRSTFEKTVPAAPIVEPVGISPVDKITKQMEELKLSHAEFLRAMNANTTNATNTPSSSQNTRELRCFFCDLASHRLGLHNCPEVKACISEGLAAYTPQGRLARVDGSELPRAYGSEGGVAKVLRDQRAAATQAKGKGRDYPRDLPPHMTANYAGLQFDGEDVLSSDIFNASAVSLVPAWRAPPADAHAVTRSQKDKEVRFDPIKRQEKKEPEAKSFSKPQEHRNRPPTPTPSNLGPPPSNLKPTIAPVQSTPQAFNLRPAQANPRPPPVNTEEAFKNRRAAPSKSKPDVEMKDAQGKAKSTPLYHFTSDVQEMYNLDKIVQEKVNKTIVQLELGELLAISAFLQKSVSNMTKTRREYTTKPVMASVVEVLDEADWSDNEPSSALTGGYESDDEDLLENIRSILA